MTCIYKIVPESQWTMQDISWIFVASLLLLRCSATIAELDVTISVDYTPPPGFTPGPNEYRAASGPVTVTCTAIGETGTINYQWSSTCRDCPFSSSTSKTIRRASVHSGDTGTHTCMATTVNSENVGSASINITVIGVGIHVFDGNPFGSFPNNGLVISSTMNQIKVFYTFRFFCRSDSMEANVGYLIGLNEENLTTDNHFTIDNPQPGELRVINGTQNLTTSEQGVYTCCIPQRNGTIEEINIGLYPNGFETKPSITNLMFSSGNTSSNLTCTSTGSPATTVTWMRDGQPLTIDGSIYQHIQRVTNRKESTYENVLIINNQMLNTSNYTYSCKVENYLGMNKQSIDLTVVLPVVTITEHGTPMAGETSFYLNCSAVLPYWAHVLEKPIIEFANISAGINIMINNTVMVDKSTFTRILQFSPLQTSHGGDYICQVTFNSRTVSRNISLTVQIPSPTVTVTADNDLIYYAGSNLTLICIITVNGVDDLTGTTTINHTWIGPRGNALINGRHNRRITVTDAIEGVNGTYSSMVLLTPLHISDTGNYSCQADVSHMSEFISLSDVGTSQLMINVKAPNVSVMISTDGSMTAGESFSITCFANIPDNLEATFTVTWMNIDSVMEISTNSTAVYARTTLKTSDAGLYTCVVNITSPYLDSTLILIDAINITVQIPPPELTVTHDPDASATLYQGDNLTLICTIQLDTAVDIPVIVIGQLSGHPFQNTTSEKPYRIQKIITATTSENFTCTVTINPTPDASNVEGSEEVHSILAVTVDMNVTISVDYNPPHGFTPGPNEYRAASGPVTVTCIVTGGIGNIIYQWSSTCNACRFNSSNSVSVNRTAVHSGDSGNHTCTAYDNNTGNTGKASIKFNVTGYGIYIFHGKPGGALSNNELTTFLENPKKNFYFRLHCHSDSVMENVGKLIGLENMTVFNSSFFTITNAQPGELEVVNKDGFNQTPLPDLEQGIYTCCIPLQNQKIKEINIGIYASGFKTTPSIINMDFTFRLPFPLTCTSTGSPATNVTWMKDGRPVNIHTGTTYQMVQNVKNRRESTYENVLFINDSLTNVVYHTYTCNVSNVLGSALENHTVTAPNVSAMTSPKGSGTAGEEYSIICDVNGADDLDAEFHLMWIAPNKSEVTNQTRNDNHLTHTFRADIADAGLYTCIANITYLNSSLILNNTISITIQIPTPTVSITRGSETPIYAGSNLSLICTTTLNEIPMVALSNITVNSSWAGPFEKANERATSDVIQNNTVFTSTLIVTMLHISDTGNYSCRSIISHTSNLILSSETGLTEDIIVVEAPVLSVETSTKGSGVAGETLTICCFVNGTENLAANFTLTWMDKNGTIVKRYTGRDSNLTHTFNPKVSDAGLYVCSSVITSPYLVDNALSRNETLNVHIQAQNVSDVSVMTSSEGSATAGEEYSINCKVNGADNLDAEFHLMWIAQNKSEVASQRRNDSHLTHTFTADIADAGLYTCIANITYSYINSSLILNTTMNITIQIPTPTVSITHGSETPIYAGSNLSLICTITLNGIPMDALSNITVNSSWTGPNEKSIEGVRIATTQENDTAFTSILMITTLHLSDTGNYSCRATVGHISDLILSSETGLKEKLIAVTAPRVSMETSSNGSRIAGKTLTLCCFVNGTDNLAAHFTLTWMDKTGIMIQNYSGRDNNLSHTFYPNVSDAGPYVCSGIITSPYLDNSTLRVNETLNVYVQIPQPTLTLTRDPDANVTLRHGDSLSLTCTIQLDTAVDSDVVVTGELCRPEGTAINPTMVSDRRYQMILVVPLLSAGSLETYICTTVISPGMSDRFVSASKEHYRTLNISVELRVSITVSYTPPPGVVLGPNEYRVASGPVNVTCTVMGASGSVSYRWSSTCRDCPFKEPDESTKQSIVRFAVHSGDTGSHNCTATANEDEGTVTGSSTIDFNVVGSGIHVFQGWPRGSLPNNGLVIANDSKDYHMRFFCRSNSLNTPAGLLIGLNVTVGNPLSISHPQPGELLSIVFPNVTFGENHQGIYTCRIPLASGVINDINIGIYPPGFISTPVITSVSFMSGSSSSIITCSSTGSPATVVIWTVKNGLVLTMRDGNSTTVDGIKYQLTQTVENRHESSYTNVLTINTTSVENIFGYQCGVMNALGNSDMVNVTGAVTISTDGDARLGGSYTLNCTVIGVTSGDVFYEWSGPGMHRSSSELTIDSIGFQNVGAYTCTAIIGNENISGKETVSVRIPKPAVTISSSAGTIHSDVYSGSVLTLTCTVTINEQVPQNEVMVNISWTKGFTIISNTTRNERITVSDVQQIGTSLNYTSTIVFNTFRQSDAGEYRCQANITNPSPYVTDGIDSDNHTITIQAHTVNITTQANPTVGENYTITCTVTVITDGVPGNLTADWSGPGVGMDGVNDVTYTNGSTFTLILTFNPLRQSHNGVYNCSAHLATVSLTNSANTTIDATIPVISVAIFSGTGETNVVGERFLFICNVSGANKLKGTTKIEWKHPNAFPAPSGIGTALEYPFTNVALTDAGLYTCNVTITDSSYLNNEITMSDTQELVISIPSPMVTITTNTKGTIYAGSVLEMSCTIILGGQVVENKQILVVNSRWTGPDGTLTNGTRITLTPAVDTSSNGEYTSTVTIDTLRKSDSGTYSCMVTVSQSESEFITDGMNTSSANVNVQDPRINVSLMSNTTRLPSVPPYNTFSLTCTATVPEGVVSPKTFTWWRKNAIISSTFTRVDSEAVYVVNNHPVSTSVLTAAETTTGTWHYQCTVALLELGNIRNTIIDADPIYVTGPTDPEPPTNFVASAIGTESATICLFVPIIAFTPESYVVHYGTSNETIDSTSRPVEIANFTDKNFKLSIVLSDLMPKTLYFYLVNASNTQGFASSQIEMFTTKIEQDTSCINSTAAVGGAMGFVVTLLLTINIIFLTLKYRKKKVTMVGEPCGSAKERKSDVQIVECVAYPKVNRRCGIDNAASSTFNISQHSNTTASIRNQSYEFVSREVQPQDRENTHVYETIH